MTLKRSLLLALIALAAIPSVFSQEPSVLKGTVAETMDSGGYTYILLQNGEAKIWVATSVIPVKVGMPITLEAGMIMTNFESKSLNRTFDQIVFSSGLAEDHSGHNHAPGEGHSMDPQPSAANDPIAALAKGGWKTKGSTETPQTEPSQPEESATKVDKAQGENSYTVAELFANASSLSQKPVRIRGKVVKTMSQILGKNWIHIQDGTGDPDKKDNDIVVTSQDMPKKGEVVTMVGTLYTNKDFGAGYSYPVIIEEASIVP